MSQSEETATDCESGRASHAKRDRLDDMTVDDSARAELTISESRDGWTLRLSSTLLSALSGRCPATQDGQCVTVTIQPNLVPGEPFVARLVL